MHLLNYYVAYKHGYVILCGVFHVLSLEDPVVFPSLIEAHSLKMRIYLGCVMDCVSFVERGHLHTPSSSPNVLGVFSLVGVSREICSFGFLPFEFSNL